MLNIRVGDSIVDCDPRANGRRGTVVEFNGVHAVVEWEGGTGTGKKTKVNVGRIHDSDKRRTGVRLVPRAP